MPTDTPDLRELAAAHTAARTALSPAEQRIALATYRLLSDGQPVSDEAIAEQVGLPLAEVTAYLARPMRQRNDAGGLIGFGGLTLKPTTHSLDLGGRTLYAWCALDALFLPELLGQPTRIRSTCPHTGEPITLLVDATGPHEVAPAGAVISLVKAEGLDTADVIATFCCHVHFFASEQAARTWINEKKRGYVVPIPSAYEFGRLYTRERFGAAVTEDENASPPTPELDSSGSSST